jgi:hypothetical protein
LSARQAGKVADDAEAVDPKNRKQGALLGFNKKNNSFIPASTRNVKGSKIGETPRISKNKDIGFNVQINENDGSDQDSAFDEDDY